MGAYDFMEGHQTVIDRPHVEIHEGEAYFAVASAALTATQVVNMRIQTPDSDKLTHVTFDLSTALLATFGVYETTTFTYVTANDITAFNRNRNSDNTSANLLCHTPGGSGDGTALAVITVGGASANGRSNGPGAIDSRGELILKKNTAYLLRVTSGAASNAYSLVVDWYEHTFAI